VPISASRSPSPTTSRAMEERVAPSVIRTPISRVRWPTLYEGVLRMRRLSATLKTVVVAPIPRAIVSSATAVQAGPSRHGGLQNRKGKGEAHFARTSLSTPVFVSTTGSIAPCESKCISSMQTTR
jgi:hypothetical protein